MPKSDLTLRKIAIAAIKRHAITLHSWNLTSVFEFEMPESLGFLSNELDWEVDELPVALTYWKSSDWTVVTTRKVVGKINNVKNTIEPESIIHWDWGDFKGGNDIQTTKMTLTTMAGFESFFLLETGKASLIMISAIRVLSRLKKGNG